MLKALLRPFRHVIHPRNHTDRQSEILNLIAGPIYAYTITTVTYYGIFTILPYFYGDVTTDFVDGEFIITEVGPETWSLFLLRCLAVLIYFQMMANWLNIKFVSNTPNRNITNVNCVDEDHNSNLSSVLVNNNGRRTKPKGKKGWSQIPDPVSAPAPPAGPKQSYWSWKVCSTCNLNAPPRCHHCPMCQTCILKRDHHCFFAGKCVGFYNQRHFITFLIWAAFGTTYATIHHIPFMFKVILHQRWYLDIFPPFALIRWMLGSGSFQNTNYMFSVFFNFFFVLLSSNFLYEQYDLVAEGITQFESKKVNKNKLSIIDPRNMADKIRAVMGYNYGITICFPLAHWFIKPHENPYEWPEHKIYKR